MSNLFKCHHWLVDVNASLDKDEEKVRCDDKDCRYRDDDVRFGCVLCQVHRFPEGMTLDQIGELYGLTRERIRQVEESALGKLGLSRGKDLKAFFKDIHDREDDDAQGISLRPDGKVNKSGGCE